MLHAHCELARVVTLHEEVAVGVAAEASIEPEAIDYAVWVGRSRLGLKHVGQVDERRGGAYAREAGRRWQWEIQWRKRGR